MSAGGSAERGAVAVELDDVHRSFRDGRRLIEVLRGVDLRVSAGEMVAITGPSGSGKSTLLHLVGGLDEADRGSISVAGVRLGALSERERADFRNRRIGFVFQFHELLPDFTVLENVLMPGLIAGEPRREASDRARALLREVELEDRDDSFPSRLSGGERQRVAICRALMMDPEVLLADEPTGSLDPAIGERVLELLLRLQERHRTTTLLVTHNPDLAARCGRVLALRAGRIVPA